jgi:hypothetical protein
VTLKPWYNIVTPREDLREGKPLDAAEFAVHLDRVRDGTASADYQNPERFFSRTYLTKNLAELAAEVLRRLAGETTQTSAVFNMTTQFGGGKTHTLTLLYHLAKQGPRAKGFIGVNKLLEKAGIATVPETATAVFVGTEFDSLNGRGGEDGTPLRKTPWGEIAYQLGGDAGFAVVAEHDKKSIAPGGDVIRQFLPKNQPTLILMDELMNYVSRTRKSGQAGELYTFLHNLSETARGEKGVVLVVSIPASELEMSSDDLEDYNRLKKLLDRLGKAILISAEAETSEIIRRRLFEWDMHVVDTEGRIILPKDAFVTCREFAEWVQDHRQQVPQEFSRDDFSATYPFHPTVLSVFERKWQQLPRFQQTRGVLRMLALWVSAAYQEGFKGAHRDPLITLGTAPLQDTLFRTAVFEQLGESKLEGAVTTDIAGKKDSFAIRLDKEAVDTIRKARLHSKIATTVFFESSGGQSPQHQEATLPEVRLALGEPDLDIGNVETVLESLATECYYLNVEKNRYRFSLKPNLNKLLSDRRASVNVTDIRERVRQETQKIFSQREGVQRIYFPEKSSQIPDRPCITLVVMLPEQSMSEPDSSAFIEQCTREYGSSSRVYKSGLIWSGTDSTTTLNQEARNLLALETIEAEDRDRLDEAQRKQLGEDLRKAKRDLQEAVWRGYKNIALLGRDNKIQIIDLGLVHSSSADSIAALILSELKRRGDAEDGVSPNFLLRQWPPALTEWPIKAVRDAFYASPLFPRLLNPEKLKESLARGIANGLLAYIGKDEQGRYDPFLFNSPIEAGEIEFSDDMYIVRAEDAKKHIEPPKLTKLQITPASVRLEPGKSIHFTVQGFDQHDRVMAMSQTTWNATGGQIDEQGHFQSGNTLGEFVIQASCNHLSVNALVTVAEPNRIGEPRPKDDDKEPIISEITKLRWSGEVPPQKLMNFYTKVLARFVNSDAWSELKLKLSIEVIPSDDNATQKVNETKQALRDLGLDDSIEIS